MSAVTFTERFWDLLGSWSGVEEQSPSPWAPAARARAALAFKLDLAGTAVVQDYRQVRDDGAELLAHGVLIADEGEADTVLWWLFDFVGHAPEPGHGRWTGQTLRLVRTTPRGSAHHRFDLDGGRLTYAIDVTPGDQEAAPFLRGCYERVSGH